VKRLPDLADELIRRRVAVIATPGSTPALAAQAASKTIPIAFGIGLDPVSVGLVTSLNRPGANITGYTEMQVHVVSKRLELLHILAPQHEPEQVPTHPGSR
jgi:putative ABC transport system substrate-binding protein